MKKLFTLLVIIINFISVNFTFCQESVSCGPAPLSSIGPWAIAPADYLGSRGFVYDGSGYPTMQLAAQGLSACTLTPRGSGVTFSVFPGGATVNTATNVLYVNEQGGAPWNIWSVDTTTGIRTVACTMNGISFSNVTGITWDPDHSIMYGVNTNLSTSQIFSINMSTGLCNTIGSPSATCPGAISISSSKTGTLFCIDIVNDNLYKVNRSTGVFILVGALGVDANYGQDAQFDMNPCCGLDPNILYWASYETGPHLRIVDTTLGSSSIVCTYTASQICTIGIFDDIVGINKDNTITDITLYPNPAKDKITIKTDTKEIVGAVVSIYGVQGQLLLQQTLKQNNTQIDISQFPQGVYIAKIKLSDGSFVQKKFVVLK